MGSNGKRHLAALAAAAGVLVLSGCSEESAGQWKRLGLPEGASDRTDTIENLWVGAWIAALIVGFGVWALILYVVVRYRRRDEDQTPRQTRYNLPLEVLYTLAPFAVIGVLFFYTITSGNTVTNMSSNPAHTVHVVGSQWEWVFNYKEQVPGETESGVWDAGTTRGQAELVLPVNESVRFELTSPDVIHSFWVPAFYFKLDVIPGRTNTFELTPTKTGTFAGKCAELCGLYHARMIFTVRVVSAQEYRAHLKTLADRGQTGAATGGKDATSISGESESGGEK